MSDQPVDQPPDTPFTHESIHGWFNFEDIYTDMVQSHKTGVFVEVGAWLGKSTAYMGQLLRDNPECMVDFYAADTWKGSIGAKQQEIHFLIKFPPQKLTTNWR
jgi:hypothetical protein